MKINNNFELWGNRPNVCGKTFCTEGSKVRNEQYLDHQHMKFDWSSKQWFTVPENKLEFGYQQGGRHLGEGIFSYWDKNDKQMLNFSKGTKTLWVRPYEEVFAKGYSTSGGWNWTSVEKTKKFCSALAHTARAISLKPIKRELNTGLPICRNLLRLMRRPENLVVPRGYFATVRIRLAPNKRSQ